MTPTRTALVTGGTGGLGSAVTKRLLANGWRVVVPWLVREELSRLDEHPNLVLVEADLSDELDLEKAVSIAGEESSAPLFAVANLVGGFTSGQRVHESPVGVLDSQMNLNVRTAYTVTQATLPYLIRGGGGSVICMSAAATRRPFAGAAAYISSKAAVVALVETLALEYIDDHIRVNALLPFVIDTPGNRTSMPDSDRKGWAQPSSIAEVVEFLFSDRGAAITGGSIPVTDVR
ncbi:UNVERIFIED_ORG: NAD(P)-dependent dehydrogenase (short-subunit alcohol dehydrogenase family) [Nocardia globerula]|uniref:NAD(P)-dependent dehydrogenase (Short-subunit alcohol dehydrogenase family) n=1 Tax=Nocardia globerula TaxID=1818 RepID=A0A652YTE0_NOCGL|nr:SDR family oxidoreductase [Rhodococcus globerulus]NMD61321.1 SDR family oxidoreductase [Nocardia globerula]PVX67127.1 NAD(P)-dependent dehydrogenase (short-subunit alcohol dehydrogenase family) [Rhodococcus globerulus]